jgi:hypothetical protein
VSLLLRSKIRKSPADDRSEGLREGRQGRAGPGLALLKAQAAKRAQDRAAYLADPARQLDKQRFAAGLDARRGPDSIFARNLAAARRRPGEAETAYGRGPW